MAPKSNYDESIGGSDPKDDEITFGNLFERENYSDIKLGPTE